ncbi:hypothetical protein Q3G72_033430 [Acer saccharum]|nr:hypothetical protein Q3G72_033430 [Acer saccharum]
MSMEQGSHPIGLGVREDTNPHRHLLQSVTVFAAATTFTLVAATASTVSWGRPSSPTLLKYNSPYLE